MINFLNFFLLYFNCLKILIFISNFNKFYNNFFINNLIKRIILIGFFKKNILIFSIIGSLEFSYFFYNICYFDFFDLYLILGFLFKNKTFHYELVSFNLYFFLTKISYFFNLPFLNYIIVSNNKKNIFYKLFNIINLNIKILLKFLNFIYFLNF